MTGKMREKIEDFVLFFLYALGVGLMLYATGIFHSDVKNRKDAQIAVSDTIVLRDTIMVEKPVTRDSVIIKYKRVEVPVVVRDTILDTVFVELPITSKYYKNSRYEAWVSGYEPSLDSISIFSETKYIKDMVKTRKSRWGLGVSVGYGVTRTRVEPFVGVSVNYNILSW